VRFRDHVGQFQGLDFTYGDGPGDHNWDYWDAQIRLAMHWMLK
jgi:S-formylglutathione hydrolase FrmB